MGALFETRQHRQEYHRNVPHEALQAFNGLSGQCYVKISGTIRDASQFLSLLISDFASIQSHDCLDLSLLKMRKLLLNFPRHALGDVPPVHVITLLSLLCPRSIHGLTIFQFSLLFQFSALLLFVLLSPKDVLSVSHYAFCNCDWCNRLGFCIDINLVSYLLTLEILPRDSRTGNCASTWERPIPMADRSRSVEKSKGGLPIECQA